MQSMKKPEHSYSYSYAETDKPKLKLHPDEDFRILVTELIGGKNYVTWQENIPNNMFTADIVELLIRFKFEMELASNMNSQMFVINQGNGTTPIPIDSRGVLMSHKYNAAEWLQLYETDAETVGFDVRLAAINILQSLGLQIDSLTISKTKESFISRLAKFISTRIGGTNLLESQVQANKQTLPIEVLTSGLGYRIRYVPSVLFGSRGTILGSPSSPVKGWIKPGRYIFGADKGLSPVIWDTNEGEYEIPPDYVVDLRAIL